MMDEDKDSRISFFVRGKSFLCGNFPLPSETDTRLARPISHGKDEYPIKM